MLSEPYGAAEPESSSDPAGVGAGADRGAGVQGRSAPELYPETHPMVTLGIQLGWAFKKIS